MHQSLKNRRSVLQLFVYQISAQYIHKANYLGSEDVLFDINLHLFGKFGSLFMTVNQFF